MAIMSRTEANVRVFLAKKWKSTKCVLCGDSRWLVNGFFNFPSSEVPLTLAQDGKSMPTIAVTCENCGNTYFINAYIAGVVSQ